MTSAVETLPNPSDQYRYRGSSVWPAVALGLLAAGWAGWLLLHMLERPDSHLVNVCSVAGLVAGGRKDRAVPEPPKWISTTPDRVAKIALRAIRRNRRLVLITPLAHLLWNLKKFAPWRLDFANHLGRKKRPKASPAEATAATEALPRRKSAA